MNAICSAQFCTQSGSRRRAGEIGVWFVFPHQDIAFRQSYRRKSLLQSKQPSLLILYHSYKDEDFISGKSFIISVCIRFNTGWKTRTSFKSWNLKANKHRNSKESWAVFLFLIFCLFLTP